MSPRYPVYVVSKGRWESRLTARMLDRIGVSYRIVVEPQERESYASVLDPSRILCLPFSNLGHGSIPARNWIWEHARAAGARRHWILDDNIRNIYRLNRNTKVAFGDGSGFRIVEDYTERWANVGLSGMNYESLVPRKKVYPPIYINTRIYSCILIDTSLPFRWRGRYNEDTDLSIRALKAGLCTILFNSILADKVGTMRMQGGNTDELYIDEGRLLMAQSLIDQHPDVVRLYHKWGRPQHLVNYESFKKTNKLEPRECEAISHEHGLQLQELTGGNWTECLA